MRTLDHVVPVRSGGKGTVENVVVACQRCNTMKGHRSLAWLEWELLPVPDEPIRQPRRRPVRLPPPQKTWEPAPKPLMQRLPLPPFNPDDLF